MVSEVRDGAEIVSYTVAEIDKSEW